MAIAWQSACWWFRCERTGSYMMATGTSLLELPTLLHALCLRFGFGALGRPWRPRQVRAEEGRGRGRELGQMQTIVCNRSIVWFGL